VKRVYTDDDEYEDDEGIDVWLCGNDQLNLGLLGLDLATAKYTEAELIDVETNVELPTPGGGKPCTARLLPGSCLSFAVTLSKKGDLLVRYAPTPDPGEFLEHAEALFGVKHTHGRRGSDFFSAKDMGGCMEALRSMKAIDKVLTRVEEVDECQIALILSVFYGVGNRTNKMVSFRYHYDRPYLGKGPYRSNMTNYGDENEDLLRRLQDMSSMAEEEGEEEEYEEEDGNEEESKVRKVMRFQNLENGFWFDLHCLNGTIVEQSMYASGIGSDIVHAIFNARNTVTITWDHGPKYDEFGNRVIRAYKQEELDAAGEEQDKDNEDKDEGGDAAGEEQDKDNEDKDEGGGV
jgi:hypothetical protein